MLAYCRRRRRVPRRLGFLNYPFARLRGYPPSLREKETDGIGRYFGLCTDHKVVGIQYLIGIGVFFFIGGLNAMLIRTDCCGLRHQVWPAGTYLTLVGLHGTMMMGMFTSGILGPFANYLVPILIGARRMAFPRIEALTFWLLMAAGVILETTVFFGGFPTGWTGYQPLGTQANPGVDYYLFFALVGISMTLLGLNMLATIVTMRAPGLTWTRLPIFVWGVISTAVLMVLAAPVLVATLSMALLDRVAQTNFFVAAQGGSSYLYENLFWVFGHPEVYILALPGFAIVLEILPVFARKPLWGYRLAVAGLLGVSLLSFFVWQHHLFFSGMNGDLRPFYMFSTELISLPTGFTFLCGMMTLWRGQIRYSVPMLFCLAWFFNFLIGGLYERVFLSDVPSDTTTHGSFFSMAHFHYTIMGGLVFTFFAGIYYSVQIVGLPAERAPREDPLLVDVPHVQLDLLPALRRRVPGRHAAPRRDVSEEPPVPQPVGVRVGVRARSLDAALPLQLREVARLRPRPGSRRSMGVEARSSGSCLRRRPCTTSTASRSSRVTRTATASPPARWRFPQAPRQG